MHVLRKIRAALCGCSAINQIIRIMEKYTLKELKRLISIGTAKDVTHSSLRSDIPEPYTLIGYSCGTYGCNGMLLKGESGQLYAVTGRTSAIYIFLA